VGAGPRASSPAQTAGTSAEPNGWHSRGYLPHLDAPDLVQHVVFRLADSLPSRIREAIAKTRAVDRVQAVDTSLDQGYGRRDLAIPEIAKIVQRALFQFDGERYSLIAWCVMPNHVHTLIQTLTGHRLDQIVHAWKSFTAKQANQYLKRSGAFWAPEYFDRYMRDDGHLAATRLYIEQNPVRAGLCQEASHWGFSSAWPG
jgi:REP-associated tyrosine transposase